MNALEQVRASFPDTEIYMIDIGSNIGWYSLAAASIGFKSFAFEPFEENVKYIN